MRSAKKPVLVVSGLAAEARIAADPDVLCVVAPPAALAATLEELGVGVSAVISFGLAGGLDPILKPGALVVASSIVFKAKSFTCDQSIYPNVNAKLETAGFPFANGSVAGTDAPVMTVAGKTELRQTSGALAVDTESHIAARFAEAHGLPFGAIRVVCDPAGRDLPPLAIDAIRADGRLDFPAIRRELLTRPRQMTALPATALATARAMRMLRRVRRLLGPRLGF